MNRRARLAPTLWWYVAREILVHSALAFAVAALIILVPNLIERTGDFTLPAATAADLWWGLACIALLVAGYALPIAFLFGLLLAVGRLFGDAEVRALRACGLGASAVLLPAVAVGALLAAVSVVFSLHIEHRAWRNLKALELRVTARGLALETGRFEGFGERMILVREREGDLLRGVVISDGTDPERPFLVFAESARLVLDRDASRVRFELADGDLRFDSAPSDAHDEYRIAFTRYDYGFDAPLPGAERWPLTPSHLAFDKLTRARDRAARGERLPGLRYSSARYYEAQIHRLLAVPVAPLLFAFVGAPLGLLGVVSSRGRGALLAIALLAAYYALFVWGYDAARAGDVPPAHALWAADALIAALGAGLLVAIRRVP